jgi:hypothetical protein
VREIGQHAAQARLGTLGKLSNRAVVDRDEKAGRVAARLAASSMTRAPLLNVSMSFVAADST